MPGSDAKDTSKDLIYSELRRAIVLGRCLPGDRLELEALARRYGTSVTPVRDALQMLAQEELVTIKPRSGYFVTHITLKQLQDMLELRKILELAAVERAATRITDEQLEELGRVHAGYAGDDDEACERYASENQRFHYLVARASGNEALADSINGLHDRLTRFMILCGTDDTMESHHGQLIKALHSRDVTVARQVLLDEIEETRRVTVERVIQQEGAFWRLGTRSTQTV
jgi:DNA-binding GntR family transcriptional regulator